MAADDAKSGTGGTGGFDDKVVALARIYADALLRVADGAGLADEVREEMDTLGTLQTERPAFHDFLVNRGIEEDERRDSLESMFRGRLSDVTVNFLQVLNRKERSALLPAVVAAYRDAHDRLRRRVEVRVTSARPLSDDQRGRLAAAIRRRTGMDARFDETVDASLLGGMVVQIGDAKTDGSAATRLHNLSEALLARASREIHSGTHVEGTAT